MNIKRRNFLKFLAIGGGGIVLGKLLGGFGLFGSGSDKTFFVEKDFGAFRVSEDQRELVISDAAGKKILIIDKVK